MKKIITLAALAAICFASCSKNEVSPLETENNQIGFGMYVGQAPIAKAADIDNATDEDLTNSGFVVSAYYTGNSLWENYTKDGVAPNFMLFEKVTYGAEVNGTKWSYTDAKYWPSNTTDRITFVAYAPANITTEVPTQWTKENGKISVNIESVIANQKDLLWAEAKDLNKNIKDNAAQTNNGIVKFAFGHKLCRLGVKAKMSESYNYNIKVVSVELGETAFATKCNFTALTGDVVADRTGSPATQGFTLKTPDIDDTYVLTTTAESISKNHLILAPEEVTVPVKVTYTTLDKDATLANPQTITNVKEGDVTFTMTQGKQYYILLNVSLDKIEFDVESTGAWEDGNPLDTTWENGTVVTE